VKRYITQVIVAAAVSCVIVGPAAAQSVDATIDRAVKTWAGVTSARATFEQTISNSLTGGSASARGEFLQQRPGRLAIRFTEPSGDRIISDGKSLWIYLPSSSPGQVVKRPASAGGISMDITGQFLEEPRSKYDISDAGAETVAGEATRVLTLVPKPGSDAPFTRAKVWISEKDALIKQFEVAEKSGVTRRVRLTTLALNVPVERAAFTFTPPKGVRVVQP
jgi:outer membrane lipoprotein carrier protein